MKFKSLLIFFTVLLFFVFPLSLFAQQRDFYGTWIAKYSEDNVSMVMKFTFAASSFSMGVEVYLDGSLLESETIDGTITKWTAKTNGDNDTKTAYPNGFEITATYEGADESLTLFISRDKRQMILSEMEMGTEFVFVKQ